MSTIKVTNIQHASASTAAIALNTSGQATLNGLNFPTAGPLSNRNLIINGDMRIDQRNAGAAVTADGNTQFSSDRWFGEDGTDGTFTLQRVTSSVPADFIYSLVATTGTADTSLSATQLAIIGQRIEGLNTANLNWGSSDAKSITVSFWTRSSLTGNFGGSVWNNAADRSYVFSYTINTADTWEHKTVTIPGDTSGTWLTDTGRGINIGFTLGAGSTYQADAGSWNASLALTFSSAVSVIGTASATLYITGVQLEVGSVATPFEHRSYGDELARCQRYYWNPLLEKGQTNVYLGNGAQYDGTTSFMVLHPPVTMRTEPSADFSNATGHFAKLANNSATNFSTFAIDGSNSAACITVSYNASGSGGHANFVRAQNADSKFAFSAEL